MAHQWLISVMIRPTLLEREPNTVLYNSDTFCCIMLILLLFQLHMMTVTVVIISSV